MARDTLTPQKGYDQGSDHYDQSPDRHYSRLEYGIANTDREAMGSGLMAQPPVRYAPATYTQRNQFVRNMYSAKH